MPGCPSCGRESYPEDAFCSQCGTRLQARSPDTGVVRRTILKQTTATIDRLACGSCNGPLLAGEVFCAACGARYGPDVSQPEQREFRAQILSKLETATRGKFEFVREIGRGGMGAVYLARELDLERNVAIKVLSSSWLTDGSMVERFRREAKTIASLRHPSIVHVHGVGRAEDIHYFVMDFIDGVSLGRILLTHGPLSIPVTLAILGQVGSALNYAHRPDRSVIHRDIKPGNIMVDGEGGSYVTDFGISKATGSQSGLTMTGLIMGTPEYMSPEQCRGDAAGPAADQYALGAVAFAMLTGSPPFTGPHYRVLVGHTSEPPPAIRELRPDCPSDIADAVARMLEKAPADRWPDVSEAMTAMGARPTLHDDPVREELAALVAAARRSPRHGRGPTPEVVGPAESGSTPSWLRILSVPESLEMGDAIDLRAIKGFADGREIENGDITWESTDPAIARIDPDTGRLVAIGAGSAVITASVADVQESVPIKVQPARVAQLVVDPSALRLEVGETGSFGAEPRSRAGRSLERRVLWSSSDPGVATIGDDGDVSAHREGTASVLAHCEGVGSSATVTVVPASVATFEINEPTTSLHVGDSARIDAVVRDARGARLDRVIAFSTSDASIARVTDDGLVEAIAQGAVSIKAECEGRSAAFDLHVSPPPAAAIRTSSPPSELIEGDTFHLVATPLDADGRPLDVAIDWSVADEKVIDSLGDGRFRALADGQTTVTARSGSAQSDVELSVDPLRAASLVLGSPPQSIHVDEVAELTVYLRDQRGRPVRRSIAWSTSDPWVARVNARGVVEGAGPGTATITAECDGMSDSAVIEVTASPWATVVFKPEAELAPETRAGDTAVAPVPDEPAIHSPADDPRRRLLWAVPVVVAGIAGAAWFGLKGGEDPPPAVPADPVAASVAIIDQSGAALTGALQLAVGDTIRLAASVTADDGTPLRDASIEWSSADPSLASIDGAGTLIARAAGALSVLAVSGDVSRAIDVTIAAPPPPVTAAAEPPVTSTQATREPSPPAGTEQASPPAARQTPPAADPTPPDSVVEQTPPPDGLLQLNVLPWADIWVDGEQQGRERRRLDLQLPPGRHTLRLENPNMVTIDTTFEIVSGQARELHITLTPRGS